MFLPQGLLSDRAGRPQVTPAAESGLVQVVIEAKASARFSAADFAQLNRCLHFANFEVGLLINFHNWPRKDGGSKRLVNTKP